MSLNLRRSGVEWERKAVWVGERERRMKILCRAEMLVVMQVVVVVVRSELDIGFGSLGSGDIVAGVVQGLGRRDDGTGGRRCM